MSGESLAAESRVLFSFLASLETRRHSTLPFPPEATSSAVLSTPGDARAAASLVRRRRRKRRGEKREKTKRGAREQTKRGEEATKRTSEETPTCAERGTRRLARRQRLFSGLSTASPLVPPVCRSSIGFSFSFSSFLRTVNAAATLSTSRFVGQVDAWSSRPSRREIPLSDCLSFPLKTEEFGRALRV
uniref:Uncharacterized protein n=1 Tax=Toxoplasma gondii COUG TaxID=1074873 RepID=A0A2G8XPX0_TOXGO|nr:hypothetical protein TGCOUG_395560 [Toxoplasma gondii COUG]